MARTITYRGTHERRSVIVSAANIIKGSPKKFQKMLIDGYPYGKVDKEYGQADWRVKSQAQINERFIANSTLIHPSSRHFEWPLEDVSDKVFGAEQPDLLRSKILLDVMLEVACIYKIDREISNGKDDKELEKEFQLSINNIVRMVPMTPDSILSNDSQGNGIISIGSIIEAIENMPFDGMSPELPENTGDIAKKAANIWMMLKQRINTDEFNEKQLFDFITMYSAVVSILRKKFLGEVFSANKGEDTIIVYERGIFSIDGA